MSSITNAHSTSAAPGRAQAERARPSRVNVGTKERFLTALGGGALLLYGLGRKGAIGVALKALGGVLVARGATGRCGVYRALGVDTSGRQSMLAGQGDGGTAPLASASGAIRVEQSITIQKPREEVYRFFRDLSNLPRFMADLDQVDDLGAGRSRWLAKMPLQSSAGWEASITEDVEGERIGWRSTEGAEMLRAGTACFTPAPGGRGTEVTVVLDSDPKGGRRAMRIACEESALALREDLRRLKQLMEAGEIPTIAGQPSGRKGG